MRKYIFILVIAIVFAYDIAWAQGISFNHDLPPPGLVEVEQSNILPSDLSGNKALVPYQIRRKDWASLFAVTYSLYHPKNYETDYENSTTTDFDELYGKSPMYEISYALKRNILFGSIGGEIGYGYYMNQSDEQQDAGDLKLTVQFLRLGGRITLDNIWEEPYVAPYGIGGAYTTMYRESQPNTALNGTTAAGTYFGGGLLFQLNRLDPYSATEAYVTGGVENTFLFVEARTYLASTDSTDPDFSTGVDLSGGLTVEF